MTSQLKVDRISPANGSEITIDGFDGESSVKAWVNFNGLTGSIRASMNVSSITDNDTGDYSINFEAAMPDANYSTIGTTGEDPITFGYTGSPVLANESQSTTSVNIKTGYSDSGGYMVAVDWTNNCIGILR
jgi:hypothetical protein